MYRPVFPVVAGRDADLPRPHPVDAFGHHVAARGLDVPQRQVHQDPELRPQLLQHLAEDRVHLLALLPHPPRLGDDLGQREQVGIGPRPPALLAFLPVGQFLHPGHDPYRDRLAALRAEPLVLRRLPRVPAHAAGTVPVEMVLAFLGEELDRAPEPLVLRVGQGAVHTVVRIFTVKNIGLAAQLRGRMRVGVRHQHEPVELPQPPVHQRVRRQPGLQGEDVPRQVLEALLDGIEPALRPQDREPGRPDMGGDKDRPRVSFQRQGQQVFRVQAQDRPAVGLDVADAGQALLQPAGGLQAGNDHDVVYLPHLVALLVDARDLGRKHEPHRTAAGRRDPRLGLAGQLRLQLQEPGLRRLQLFLQLVQPVGLDAVSGRHHADPLELRPQPEVLRRQVRRRGAGIFRMDVQVSDKSHFTPCSVPTPGSVVTPGGSVH